MHPVACNQRARVLALAGLLCLAGRLEGATVPGGFVDETYTGGLSSPTAMQFAPDGRLFVCEQDGRLRVVEDGNLLPAPFISLPVNAEGERGLLGVAFDPDFEGNQYVYVYYTATTPTVHNRVSRFTAGGNVAVPGSEFVVVELDPLSTATNHNGGAIHFGNDGKLYVAVGDNGTGSNSQTLTNLLGKVLRIAPDGSIPADNPLLGSTTGRNRAIWAYGLRNPFTTAFQPTTGRLFINDVGETTWEEIDEGIAGANYGWPASEGPSSDPGVADPIHYYGRTEGCAVTGGAFYEPPIAPYPPEYFGDYFFADYCGGWIRTLETSTATATHFAGGLDSPVDLKVGPDGALYYLSRSVGSVGRIRYTGSGAPAISRHPANSTVTVGQSTTFTVTATGTPPLNYQWRRNQLDVIGANGESYTLSSAQLADNGSSFDVVVTNGIGSATSNPALLTVTQNAQPSASITQPVVGTSYAGGDVISYSGTGSDAEDGTLPASAMTWWVNLHHDGHTHPHLLPTSGSASGSFAIPTQGETSANVFYRVSLRVTDSGGLSRTVIRDVLPRKVNVTLDTIPTGLQVRLDGQPVTAPHSFVGVVGMIRHLEADSPQLTPGGTVNFVAWSDGGARAHDVSTPASDTTYVASFGAPREFAIGNARLLEGNGGTSAAVFTITLSGPTTEATRVDWSTANGSARAGTDYAAGAGTVEFPPGASSRTVTVWVIGDDLLESNETFFVNLSAPVGATLSDAQGSAIIVNDDGPGVFRFSAAGYKKTESGLNALITVKRTGGAAAGVTVGYATSDGSAASGEDYTATTGTLNFGAGVSSMTFAVPLKNDAVIEPDESVHLNLSNPSSGAVLGTPSAAVLTIVNDDKPGVISFSSASYQKSEFAQSVTIRATRTGGTASGIFVEYETVAITAGAGVDYVDQRGTLEFSAGQTAAFFSIPLINDAAVEGNETVRLQLRNPSGGATLGSTPDATLTILDDD